MGVEDDGGAVQSGIAASPLELACPCLNVRVMVVPISSSSSTHAGREDDEHLSKVVLDEDAVRDGGAVRIQHLQLASEVLLKTTASKSNTAEEDANDEASDSSIPPLSCLRCLNCSTTLLTYPAAPASSPMQPSSQAEQGEFHVDISDSSKLVVGSKTIEEFSDKTKNPDWSDLFRLVVPLAGSSLNLNAKRSPSSDTLSSRRSDDNSNSTAAAAAGAATPNNMSESSSSAQLKRSDSSGSNAAARGGQSLSPFQTTARARIKQNRQALEKEIQSMRDQFEADSKKYLDQADSLTARLRSATRAAAKRAVSPSSTRAGQMQADKDRGNSRSGSANDSSARTSTVVIKGGFDGPPASSSSPYSSKATSPTRSQTVAPTFISSTSHQPVTSPHLASSGNYPSLFSTLSGVSSGQSTAVKTNGSTSSISSSSKVDETSRSRERNNGIVQATAPQSPTFRRSRSPSPSRDTSQTRVPQQQQQQQSREQSRSRSAEASKSNSIPADKMQEPTAAPMFGSSYRRPALNLDRDISQLEIDRATRTKEEEGRGRTTGSTTNTRQAASRTGGAWLRLNGLSPSPPPKAKPSSASDAPKASTDAPVQADAATTSSTSTEASAGRSRPSVHRDRHVSFKDPEDQEGNAAGAAVPLHEPSAEEEYTGEEPEVPFDMDEDLVHSADEEDSEKEDDDIEIDADEKVSTLPQGSGQIDVAPLGARQMGDSPVGTTRPRTASDSLSAVLKDPTSFIGSLKSRNLGAYAGSVHSDPLSPSRNSGKAALSSEERANLSAQAQRLRDLLALDAPSHRGGKNRNKGNVTALLHGKNAEVDEDIPDDELDKVAPVSLAMSLPISIGIPRFNRKEEFDFERKTSVPQKESMLVPKLTNSKRERPVVGTHRLPALGEESESPITSRATSPTGAIRIESSTSANATDEGTHSPPVQAQRDVPAREDAEVANVVRDEEADEAVDQVKELRPRDQFVPPHVWNTRKVGNADLLGTSVHDYE